MLNCIVVISFNLFLLSHTGDIFCCFLFFADVKRRKVDLSSGSKVSIESF